MLSLRLCLLKGRGRHHQCFAKDSGFWVLIPYIQLDAGSLHQERCMTFQIQHIFNQISPSSPHLKPNVPPDILSYLRVLFYLIVEFTTLRWTLEPNIWAVGAVYSFLPLHLHLQTAAVGSPELDGNTVMQFFSHPCLVSLSAAWVHQPRFVCSPVTGWWVK